MFGVSLIGDLSAFASQGVAVGLGLGLCMGALGYAMGYTFRFLRGGAIYD